MPKAKNRLRTLSSGHIEEEKKTLKFPFGRKKRETHEPDAEKKSAAVLEDMPPKLRNSPDTDLSMMLFGDSSADMPSWQQEQESDEDAEPDGRNWKELLPGLLWQVCIAILCAYFIFLTYGVIMTDYSYGSNGTVVPTLMDVEDVQAKKDYERLVGQYENCRKLYEAVLVLDYRVAQGMEDPMAIAPEYNALLDDKKNTNDVSDLTARIKGMDIPAKHSSIREWMNVWVSTDVAEYLQLMNDGLGMNDSGILNEALARRTTVYNDFSILTQNMVAIGEGLKGVDLSDMKQWSPESYIDGYINGN